MKTISILNYELPCYDYMDGYKQWGDFLEVKKEDIDPNYEAQCREVFLEQIGYTIEVINKARKEEGKKDIEIVMIEFFKMGSRKKDIREYWWKFWGK